MHSFTGALPPEIDSVFGVNRTSVLPPTGMSQYIAYSRLAELPANRRLPRDRLTRIATDVYFKTVLPTKWLSPGANNIREPLNVTIFFELICLWAELG